MNLEIEKKIEETQIVYQKYIDQIKNLKLRQEKIVLDFIKQKEAKHLEKIRQEIKNKN
ncbi:MAG TPA: hypothetical protein PK686_01465 [bacterium]|nr:hypothetical protein [bacterium]HPV65336.1 hypothetical protein [bacterium]